jgi:DNA polymerase-3 subunit alpha
MGKINELVSRAKELGQPALAITDHGNMYGVYDLYKECKAQGIQPIYGIEFYHKVENDDTRYHLIALAKSMKGLRTLYRLHAKSHYNKEVGLFGREYPIITYNDLLNDHEDIIITTACIGGHIPQLIRQEKTKEAQETIEMLVNVFKDDFYFEIQANTLEEQKFVNKYLCNVASFYGIKVIATCDTHYVYKEDASVHEMLLCIQSQKKMDDPKRFKFPSNDFWLKSEEEMLNDLVSLDKTGKQAINNTMEIMEKCKFDFELPKQEECLPKFSDDENALLRQACNTGWKTHVKNDFKQRQDRTSYELQIIEQKGYSGYFNIVSDYVSWAKNNRVVVGAGRGSICGSHVAWLANITSIDPMKYGLLFERFLNPERMSSPDADIDFNDRDKVVQYLKERWGWRNVSSIIAHGTLTAKAVMRKILSIHNFTQAQINEISKSLPKKLNLSLADCESSEVFMRYKDKYPELFNAMYRLENVIDHTSQHAAGILITPREVESFVPCGYDKTNDILISGFDKYMLEELGLYKFDILKLETLNTIDDTLKLIKEFEDTDIDLEKIDYEDAKVYNELCKGNVFGVFQLESQQALTLRVAPKDFEALTLLNTLIRPGVGDINEYIARKEGKPYDIFSEMENDYMEQSLYTIAYQEQIMLRVHTLAGWSLGKGDSLRKVKHISTNDVLKKEFIEGCLNVGLITDMELILHAWQEIVDALEGGYTFNKSHSASYAKIAFQTAWLKHYYPKYFMCALMTTERADQAQIAERVNQCKQLGITILPPDINKSDTTYKCEKEGIRFAINTIKGVGEVAIDEINNLSNSIGNIINLNILYERANLRVVDKSVITALIMSGCFDFENPNRYELMKEYHLLRGEKKIAQLYEGKQMTNKNIAEFEKKYLGLYLTHSPYDDYKFKDITDFVQGGQAVIGGEITKVKTIFDKNNNKMAFVTLTTEYQNVEVIVFYSVYYKLQDDIVEGNFVMCKGKRDGNKLLLDKIQVLEVAK